MSLILGPLKVLGKSPLLRGQISIVKSLHSFDLENFIEAFNWQPGDFKQHPFNRPNPLTGFWNRRSKSIVRLKTETLTECDSRSKTITHWMNKIYFFFNFSSDPFETNRLRWFVWNESLEMNRLKWTLWNESLGMNRLKWNPQMVFDLNFRMHQWRSPPTINRLWIQTRAHK